MEEIVNQMLLHIRDYKDGLRDLPNLVNSLYEMFGTIEEKIPDDFYTCWVDTWGALDQTIADLDYEPEIISNREKIIAGAISQLENYLTKLIEEP